MCGRTACTLNHDAIENACRYKQKSGKVSKPSWTASKDKYVPSYNKAPQSYCPILLHCKHVEETAESDERKLAAMRWGLIPNWFKGDSSEKVNYSMNNARSDTLMEKRSYKIPLRKGQRCVVIADGFYEWTTTAQGKQPYYIYFPQSVRNVGLGCDDARKLLTMAGIFEKSFCNGEDVYSFTIITVDSSTEFSSIHHRMPALLETDEEIDAWLDFENVCVDEALALIKPRNCLKWHPVSKIVNNSRNNSADCQKEIKLDGLNGRFDMMKWLESGSGKRDPLTPTYDNRPTITGSKRTSTLDRWIKKAKSET